MAELRLIAALAALLGSLACGRGEAAPSAATDGSGHTTPTASGLVAPKGWRAAPAIAKAAADGAHADAITVAGSDAWAQPAMGCYAVWLSLAGGASSVDAAAAELVGALDKAGVTSRDVVKPQPGERGVLALAFERAPYRGKLVAALTNTGAITALACAWNQREPAACEASCAPLLGSIK